MTTSLKLIKRIKVKCKIQFESSAHIRSYIQVVTNAVKIYVGHVKDYGFNSAYSIFRKMLSPELSKQMKATSKIMFSKPGDASMR